MRVTADTFVRALVRRASSEAAFAQIVRHGDDDAGAIYVKVARLDGTAALYAPAPAGLEGNQRDRAFSEQLPPGTSEQRVDEALAREHDFDHDIWVVEIEDRAGRHFLDEWLTKPRT